MEHGAPEDILLVTPQTSQVNEAISYIILQKYWDTLCHFFPLPTFYVNKAAFLPSKIFQVYWKRPSTNPENSGPRDMAGPHFF